MPRMMVNQLTKNHLKLSWSSNYCISCTILITKCMSANTYGFLPTYNREKKFKAAFITFQLRYYSVKKSLPGIILGIFLHRIGSRKTVPTNRSNPSIRKHWKYKKTSCKKNGSTTAKHHNLSVLKTHGIYIYIYIYI